MIESERSNSEMGMLLPVVVLSDLTTNAPLLTLTCLD